MRGVKQMERYAAVDIGGTDLKYGVVDSEGRVLWHAHVPTEAQKGNAHLAESVTRLVDTLTGRFDGLSGIGISTAGVVDAGGVIACASENLPGYAGTSWKDILSERFGLPVRVGNDVKSAALAEAWIGAARGCANFLCITVGTGIGGAAFLNGRLFAGPHARAGEIGYMNMAGEGDFFERHASTSALVRLASVATGDAGMDGKNVFARVAAGDAVCAGVLDEWFDELAKGLANAMLCYDPEMVVVGGGVSHEGEPFLQKLRAALEKRLPGAFLDGVRLETAQCGNTAGMVGSVYPFVFPQDARL